MLEGYKEIESAPHYFINIHGDVISMKRKTPYKMKICVDKDGYEICCCHVNNKRKTIKIHREVANAFIPNPNNLPCVDHIDRNRSNNDISNLRWVDWKQNANNRMEYIHPAQRKKIYLIKDGYYTIYPCITSARDDGYNNCWMVAKGYYSQTQGEKFSFDPPNFQTY